MKSKDELGKLRRKIDSIDKQILNLLNQRMETAVRTKKYKKGVKDDSREKAILADVSNTGYTLLDKEFSQAIYKTIIKHSCKLQEKDLSTIAFQGVHGAYSQMAANKWDSSLVSLPCKSFVEIFDGIQKEIYDYGIVPIENNLGGVVGGINALLLGHDDIKIIGSLNFPVEHCLLCTAGASYRDIKCVYSHYQALAQCSNFISELNLTSHRYFDTAGAAKMISEKDLDSSAAIASQLAGEYYGLQVIKKNIENIAHNRTRFIVIGKNKVCENPNCCSIVFSCKHSVGALAELIKIFAQNKINLTRLESFYPGDGDLKFFADFQIPDQAQKMDKLFADFATSNQELKILGKYKEMVEK